LIALLFKHFKKSILTLLCFTLVIVASVAPAFENQESGMADFDDAVLAIEKIIDNNTAIAQSELKKYQERFHELSLKQKITYQHLLTDIYILQGHFQLAKKEADIGLSLTVNLASPSLLISELLYNRGFSYESMGENTLAEKDYDSGLELAKSFNDKVLIATGLANLGAIYYLTDQYEQSLIVLHDAYAMAKQTDNEELKGSVNSELGILYAYLDRNTQSMVYYQQSYQHYKKAKKTILSLNALVNIGMNHMIEQEYEQAITTYKKIIAESDGFTLNHIVYNAYSGLSRANLNKPNPNPQASYQYLLEAKKYLKNIEQFDIKTQYYKDEAFVLFEINRFNDALNSIAKVEGILTKTTPLGQSNMQVLINMINLKSKIYFGLGEYQKAYKLQTNRLSLTKVLHEKKYKQSIVEVRLTIEAKEEDLQREILKNEQEFQQVLLLEVEKKQEQQHLYLLYIAVVALLFAWLLVKLVQAQHRLYKASSIDVLTGISNRRELMKKGRRLLKQAIARNTDFSVIMIDIDHFKRVNDEFGHAVGDHVIKTVVALGEEFMRKTDVFGRYGGEEFIAFLPSTSFEQAKNIAERFRVSVEAYSWDISDELHNPITITISLGVANSAGLSTQALPDLAILINKADSLLYQAKAQGRNKVCI
jgi:diguanylate cyclase (GGDEF)-like protein